VASSVVIVFGWGYLKGYGSAEQAYQKEMNKALARQMETMLAQKELEIQLALEGEAEKYDIIKKINEVPEPTDKCSLEPNSLQWFDDILRAARTDSTSTD